MQQAAQTHIPPAAAGSKPRAPGASSVLPLAARAMGATTEDLEGAAALTAPGQAADDAVPPFGVGLKHLSEISEVRRGGRFERGSPAGSFLQPRRGLPAACRGKGAAAAAHRAALLCGRKPAGA